MVILYCESEWLDPASTLAASCTLVLCIDSLDWQNRGLSRVTGYYLLYRSDLVLLLEQSGRELIRLSFLQYR